MDMIEHIDGKSLEFLFNFNLIFFLTIMIGNKDGPLQFSNALKLSMEHAYKCHVNKLISGICVHKACRCLFLNDGATMTNVMV